MKINPRIYEINTALWLYGLRERYGRGFTLGEVPPEEWDWLKARGFDYLWLMGVWKRSRKAIEVFREEPEYASFKALFDSVLPGWTEGDLIGSPYSIASYSPDPMVGGWDDIDRARQELHRRDIGLFLDFVPNHTAPDHPWVRSHAEYYFQGKEADYKREPAGYTPVDIDGKTLYLARGKDPFFPPWTDTLQLNHYNPDMRSALVAEMKKAAEHADGLRCDMAMLVLNDVFRGTWKRAGTGRPPGGQPEDQPRDQKTEFWSMARKALPGTLLVAEAYWGTEGRLLELGFDYVYDKGLYDRLLGASPREVYLYLKADASYQRKLLRFIENHDERRSAEAFSPGALRAAAVLLSTLPGMKLYHEGQFEGRKIKVPLQLRRVRPETPDRELEAFYDRLLSITRAEVFSRGQWELKESAPAGDDTSGNLIPYVWKSGGELRLVVINLSRDTSQGRISLSRETSAGAGYALNDELSGRRYERSGTEMAGLHVILGGYQCHVFDISPLG
jgi:glycosidase